MPTKLFVGNVSDSCTEDDLKAAFEKYGPISEHAIIRNYGFVHFEKKEDAETAIKELHESELKGNVIRVLMSTTPHKTGGGRGGGGGGRGPPYSRDRDRQGYSRGPPPPRSWGYGAPPPDRGSRYHPYYDRSEYYRSSYPSYGSRGSGGYGYQYDNDYSRDYPPRSYPPSYGGGRPVTYPDVKRQPSSSQWDR